jgi:hypothetical protein
LELTSYFVLTAPDLTEALLSMPVILPAAAASISVDFSLDAETGKATSAPPCRRGSVGPQESAPLAEQSPV